MRYVLSILSVGFILGGLVACQGSSEPPQAEAGQDFSVIVGEQPTFDGCGSTGEMINYKWTIISAPEQLADDAGKVIRETDPNCSFTLGAAMGVDEVGEWVIELEVQDEAGNTSTDTVTVTVEQ